MEVPQEGKYVCKLNGQLVIYEASTGSLCGAMPCVMVESGYTFKHTVVLVKADGTIQTKTTDTLKTVFTWDGVDPFWLMDNSVDGGPMRSVEFEIVGGPETGDKGGQYFKSQWLNPLGGGMRTPMAADRRSVLAKYGTKFQALANVGGQKAEVRGQNVPARVPPVPSGAQGTARPTTPPPGTVTATMEEAWAALNEEQTGKPAEAIEKMWFDTIARLFPNKSNTDLKPHEWGKLKAEFEDQIPM
ncbi:MAG TPA: hypothetical protein PKI20_08630 [Verrucomicrobiota bacterium]|jgi:hypothetical protein|nr:hypothetical protein [Verrucomicrobiota bacterium]HQL78190.1 hypothetical protein [Verrucomicrobiota bacterium]